MAPAQAQLEAQHLPSSATSRELQPWGGRGRGLCVPVVPLCQAAVVSLLPPGCSHRSQRRRCGSCGGAAGAWELQAGHSRVRLDVGLHGICHTHLLVAFH